MKFKKVICALLFPHTAIMLMLIPVSAVFMVYSMVFSGTKALSSIIFYFPKEIQ